MKGQVLGKRVTFISKFVVRLEDNALLGLIDSFLVTIKPLHAMAAWQELLSLSLGCSTGAAFSLTVFSFI